MADLRAMAETMGLKRPRTLVATGNLVFEADGATITQLEVRLEAAFERTFGRHVNIIVRSASDWLTLTARNPFRSQSEADASRVLVRVMRDPVRNDVLAALEPYRTTGEQMHVVNGDLWVYFANGVSNSRLAAALTPKRLGIGTMRNWNTVSGLNRTVGG